MLREKLANEISIKANEKLALSRREKMLLGALGLTGLATPAIASMARDAGTVAGLYENIHGGAPLFQNAEHMRDINNRAVEEHNRLADEINTPPKSFLEIFSNKKRHQARNANAAYNIAQAASRAYNRSGVNDLVDTHNKILQNSPNAGVYGQLEASGYGPITHLENIAREFNNLK